MTAVSDRLVAIVTGAGSGIGRATAVRFAADGIRVIAVGRRLEPLRETVAEIHGRGGEAVDRVCDITRSSEVDVLVAEALERFGRIDVLVNSAGSSTSVLNPQWIPEDQWRNAIDVNLTAVFQLVQAVLPGMLEQKSGTIITVSSLAAVNPNLLGGAAYGAAKAGVRNFMSFLHTTFRGEGLRAITVLPGETDTPILENRARPPAPAERESMLQPEDIADVVALAVSLPPRAVMQEVVIAPTRQRDTSEDLAISRLQGRPGR